VIALVFALWQRSLWPVVFVLALDGGIGLFYLASTTLDPRNRPPVHILQSGLVRDHSFPSGHTGTATAIAGELALLLWAYTRIARGVIGLLAVIPVWTMLSRLYEGAHHLSDVLTALVVTVIWLAVCARMLLPARSR
jgi:undecaprenyl-diphosphatase